MTVKDLLKEIQDLSKNYPDINEWTIALEQHPDYKDCSNCNKKNDSLILHDLQWDTLFIKSHAIGCVQFVDKKTLGIQIHY